jgi:hypothetical protein
LVAKVVSSTVSIGRFAVVMSRWAVGPSSLKIKEEPISSLAVAVEVSPSLSVTVIDWLRLTKLAAAS